MSTLCKYAERCPVFTGHLADEPHLAKRIRARFCFGDWRECARYAVAEELGVEGVPADLLPHQLERGWEAISGSRARCRTAGSSVFSVW